MSQSEYHNTLDGAHHGARPLPRQLSNSEIDPELLNDNRMAHGGHHEDADGPYEEEWFQTLDRVVHERMAACFDDFKAELRADTQALRGEVRSGLKRVRHAIQEDQSDGDSEGGAGGRAGLVRRRKRAKKHNTGALQEHTSDIVKAGCGIEFFKDVQNPFDDEELEAIDFDSYSEPWRPNFLKPIKDKDNEGWVSLVMERVMQSEAIQRDVDQGVVPRYQYNRDFIIKHVLPGTWNSAKKELKAKNDPDGLGMRKKATETRTRRQESRSRLAVRRLKTADPTIDPPKRVKGVLRPFMYDGKLIPTELLTEEVMSDDISDSDYELDKIRPRIRTDEYRKQRGAMHEGVPPFFRAEKWRGIFEQMDITWASTRKNAVPAQRFYLKNRTRDTEYTVADIPAGLHRCMIADEWYGLMPDDQKATVRASPDGWKLPSECAESET